MRKHFTLRQLGRHSLSEGQQPEQVKLFDANATTGASDAGQTKTGILSATVMVCPRCRKEGEPHSKHVTVCRECYEELRQEAGHQQEAAYLCAWLRSRVDKDGFVFEDSPLVASPSDRKTALRLVRVAKGLSIPWWEPTPQVAFATRMRGLLASYGGGDDDGGEAA